MSSYSTSDQASFIPCGHYSRVVALHQYLKSWNINMHETLDTIRSNSFVLLMREFRPREVGSLPKVREAIASEPRFDFSAL